MNSILGRLHYHAGKSCLTHQHAAALISGGRIVSLGVNSLRGVNSDHAEIAAVRKYLASRGFNPSCILWN
jgi:pyrimidine deaminase RibD-like protein